MSRSLRSRERFATLTGVDRPVESGDFVSIDLVAVDVEGEEIEDGKASGMSYEVGSENHDRRARRGTRRPVRRRVG